MSSVFLFIIFYDYKVRTVKTGIRLSLVFHLSISACRVHLSVVCWVFKLPCIKRGLFKYEFQSRTKWVGWSESSLDQDLLALVLKVLGAKMNSSKLSLTGLTEGWLHYRLRGGFRLGLRLGGLCGSSGGLSSGSSVWVTNIIIDDGIIQIWTVKWWIKRWWFWVA